MSHTLHKDHRLEKNITKFYLVIKGNQYLLAKTATECLRFSHNLPMAVKIEQDT